MKKLNQNGSILMASSNFPVEFYQEEQGLRIVRTHDPNGGILVDPLDLLTPTPWSTINTDSNFSITPKKRDLIFVDPAYKKRFQHERDYILNVLRSAKKAGFSVHFLYNSELKNWDSDDISEGYECYIDLEQIRHIAWNQYALSANNICLLDYFATNKLMSEYRATSLALFDFMGKEKEIDDLAKFLSFFSKDEKKKTKLKKIIFTYKEQASAIDLLKEHQIDFFEIIEGGSRLKKEDFKKICELSTRLEKIEYSIDVDYLLECNAEKLKSLESVDFDYPKAEKVANLFKIITNLRKVTFNYTEEVSGCFQNLNQNQLLSLEELYLNYITVKIEDFDKFFKAAPRLKKLFLYFSDDLDISESLFNFPHTLLCLEHFNLDATYISREAVEYLFNAIPNLKTLDLLRCQNISASFQSLESNHFQYLEQIELYEVKLNAKGFYQLLRVAPNLKKIELSFGSETNISDYFQELRENQALYLEKVRISTAKISADAIKLLFKTVPNLKKINFSECKILSGTFQDLNHNQLQNLKAITLYKTPIDLKNLKQLLKIAKGLNRISFDSIPVSGCFNDLAENHLFNLEDVDLSSTNINANDLMKLFKTAPNIKQINLRFTGSTYDTESYKVINFDFLKNLEHIDISYCRLISREMLDMLQSMPNLKIINKVIDEDPYYTETKKEINNINFFYSENRGYNLRYNKYFKNTPPDCYRLFVWQPILDSIGPRQYTIPVDFMPLADDFNPLKRAIDYTDIECERDNGVFPMTKNMGDSVILPSIHPNEKISQIKVVDEKGSLLDHSALSLKYSQEFGFHQLILPSPGSYTVYFEVVLSLKKITLPENLNQLVNEYAKFSLKYKLVPVFNTLRQYAHYFRQNKTGRCILRALAAYTELLEQGYQKERVRIINNEVHSYLEVKVEGTWYQLDLGGYSASLIERPMTLFKEKIRIENLTLPNQKTDEKITYTNETDLLDTNNPKNAQLFLVPHISALKALYERLVNHHGLENIFIIHKITEVNLTGNGVNERGEILPNYTDLQRWLDKNSQQKRIIISDIRFLKDHELAQLNDLLDRRIEGYPLPLQIDILLVDTPERGYYGCDFKRRVFFHPAITESEKPLLLEVSKENKKKTTHSIEIELFNSPFYEQILLGSWQLQKFNETEPTKLKLRWKKGGVFKVIETSNGTPLSIVLKNPPLQNPEFDTFMAEVQVFQRLSWADQTLLIPPNLSFYQTNGYDWQNLGKNVAIEQLKQEDIIAEPSKLYYLSNTNISSFINDPAYFFSKKTGALECQDSCLSYATKDRREIRVMCVPGLLECTMAQFLAEANQREIKVTFVAPNIQDIPEESVLHRFFIKPAGTVSPIVQADQVIWELHDDVYFRIQQLLALGFQGTFFDMSSLSGSDLGRFPQFSETTVKEFLKTNIITFKAPLAAVAQKLKNGEAVVLTGTIPSILYEALTQLSLGYVEGERFTGKLIILAASQEQLLIKAIIGEKLQIIVTKPEEKINFLQQKYHVSIPQAESIHQDLAILESNLLSQKMKKQNTSLDKIKNFTDEEKSQAIDNKRLSNVKFALDISPWVMIEGKTGIGKSYFLLMILAQQYKTYNKLEEWLNTMPISNNEKIILVIDEANFYSQSHRLGDNFLERFKSLKSDPPGFLWQGNYYQLSSQHKVIFAFNPAIYGQGRKTDGFLYEHNVPVLFEALPSFYVRARIINPLLERTLKNADFDKKLLSEPIVKIYQWLTIHAKEEVFITPREIKMMVNLIAAKINRDNITDLKTLKHIGTEVVYQIAKQTIIDNQILLTKFDQDFIMPQWIEKENKKAVFCKPYQQEVYQLIQEMLHVKDHLLSLDYSDLGLGGILLEGPSKIGKSFLVNKIAEEYKKHKKVYHISPSTPYLEKSKIITQAFEEGALVIADEFNTSLWPNKILNNYLMGLDADGNSAKNPGFLLIGTQNPPSFVGRSEVDPAIRRRLVKASLYHWPRISEIH
jgi:hypothetical protein